MLSAGNLRLQPELRLGMRMARTNKLLRMFTKPDGMFGLLRYPVNVDIIIFIAQEPFSFIPGDIIRSRFRRYHYKLRTGDMKVAMFSRVRMRWASIKTGLVSSTIHYSLLAKEFHVTSSAKD